MAHVLIGEPVSTSPGHAQTCKQEALIQSLSAFEIAYCCLVIVLAYAARGSTGFGGAAAMPLMGLVVPMKVLVPAWTLLGLAAGATLLGRDSRHIAWGETVKIVPSCLVGIALGLYLYNLLDGLWLARGLGLLVLVYGGYALWVSFYPVDIPARAIRLMAPVAGFVGGVVGTVFGTLASLFFAIYFDALRMAKTAFRATMTAVLVALTAARGIGYWAIDQYTSDVWFTFAVALPMMLIGIFIGDRVHTGLSELAFRRLVCAALIVSGLALMAK